jgi:hypothetical protein
VYESNKLLNTFGEYQYPLFINQQSFKSTTNDGYEHFLYAPKKNVSIVITDKEFGMWGRFTSNSYLFIFFSLLVLFSVWFNSIIVKRSQRFSSLNNRIQFILVSIVVLSFCRRCCWNYLGCKQSIRNKKRERFNFKITISFKRVATKYWSARILGAKL